MTPEPLKAIERAGRTCYKSEDRITDDSAEKFVRMLLQREHYAMIEHASMSYLAICDRGVTHEIVRHRLYSFAQESTRYCNYAKQDCGIAIMVPMGINIEQRMRRERLFWLMEEVYNQEIAEGIAPQIARDVLPTCLKSEIVMTGNFREWRHFFSLRCDKAAHPKMQEIANMILNDAIQRVAVVFD